MKISIKRPFFTHLCKINTNMPTKSPIPHQSIYNSKFAAAMRTPTQRTHTHTNTLAKRYAHPMCKNFSIAWLMRYKLVPCFSEFIRNGESVQKHTKMKEKKRMNCFLLLCGILSSMVVQFKLRLIKWRRWWTEESLAWYIWTRQLNMASDTMWESVHTSKSQYQKQRQGNVLIIYLFIFYISYKFLYSENDMGWTLV